jgi:DNA-binding IclR family transcriptional regulator
MKSMTMLGYLEWDRRSRLFVTTPRVSLLGYWRQPALLQEGEAMTGMRRLSESTGLTVILAVQHDLHALFLHVTKPQSDLGLSTGTMLPLFQCVTGLALLSTQPDAAVLQLIRRTNAITLDRDALLDEKDMIAKIERVQTAGYAFDRAPLRTAVVALPLHLPGEAQAMALAVSGPTAAVVRQRPDLVRLLDEEVARLTRPSEATDVPLNA